ncbi:MAG: HAMP domain-containing histidine kinase [Nannocystaceae bacterium]|nr:HAMP domain-containing histidine kinase [Nannocystaceae bacterium]
MTDPDPAETDVVTGGTSSRAGTASGSVAATADAARTQAGLNVRDSLAVRIAAMVTLVLVATLVWGAVTLGQLRDIQAGFDRLVEVYAVFDKRLAQAHVQAVRIGEQVRTHQRREPAVPDDPGFTKNFDAALQARASMVEAAREPIDAALREPERFGGEDELAELRRIQASLDQLQSLVVTREVDAVLADVRAQGQIEQLFESLRAQSGNAIEELRDEVQRARTRAERWTLGLAIVTLIVGVLASIGVFLTLRPLRRLTQGVRRLGGGDWSQRVAPDLAGRGDEVGRLAAEFNLMADALQERERLLVRGERLAAAGQLAAQITHEIRNPLSAVALNVELLEDELPEHGEGRRLLGKITAEVDRLTNITESYLRFARRPKPELAALDLRAELESFLEFTAPELQEHGVTLAPELPGAPVMVLGDANQLRQALLNLVRNAKEAALERRGGAGDRAPRVGVELHCKEDAVVLVVSDNGGGIDLPPDQLERIFEAFYTRKAQGTGLGLPMVQQILADHGGSVRVAQTGPGGTRFELTLPRAAA